MDGGAAFRLLPTDRRAITEQDYYEFENRLRTVVWDILKPLEVKANDIREHQRQLNKDMEKQKKYIDHNMQWI